MTITAIEINERQFQAQRALTLILGEPCHIAFASELGLSTHEKIGGLCTSAVWQLVRAKAPSRFRGPSPGMIISDRDFDDLDEFAIASTFDLIVCHEAAHVRRTTLTRSWLNLHDWRNHRTSW
jgi:hypothetical protein